MSEMASLDRPCGNLPWRGDAEQLAAAFAEVLAFLADRGMAAGWVALYADEPVQAEIVAHLRNIGAWTQWPLLVLTPTHHGHGGLQWIGVPSGRRLHDEGRVVGIASTGPHGHQVSLCGMTPSGKDDPGAATETLIERAAHLLQLGGLYWADVYRTWYFNHDILGWYDEFNVVRRETYHRFGVDMTRVPASTGIGMDNADDAWLTLSLLAADQPQGAGPVRSPEQNAAADYGSHFSRAWAPGGPESPIFVSGTAAIDPAGKTQYLGDFVRQTERTYRVVEAILGERGRGWNDVCRATAYIRYPQDIPQFLHMEAEGLIPEIGRLVVPSVVCRDDLLFELEVDTF